MQKTDTLPNPVGVLEEKLQILTGNVDEMGRRLLRQDMQLIHYRDLVSQYRQDLQFWVKAHGQEYPSRRIQEIDKKLEEIDKL